MYLGWTQVAFAEELREDVIPFDVGPRALVAVRHPDGYIVYDGRCPHRGAHLGHGGRLEGDALVCPFHGHRVQLGQRERRGHVVQPDSRGLQPDACAAGDGEPFAVRAYPCLDLPAGLFVLLDERRDTGLDTRLSDLARTHHIHPAFTREIAVPPEYVIENVLDADHFAEVHALTRRPELDVREEPGGSLLVDGDLDMARANTWQAGAADGGAAAARAHFTAEVFSPTLVVTQLQSGADPYVVITAATPNALGGCTARVTVALPKESSQGRPTVRQLSSLVSGSRTAFEQDARVWEHLDTSVIPNYLPGDRLVRIYRDFCERFQGP